MSVLSTRIQNANRREHFGTISEISPRKLKQKLLIELIIQSHFRSKFQKQVIIWRIETKWSSQRPPGSAKQLSCSITEFSRGLFKTFIISVCEVTVSIQHIFAHRTQLGSRAAEPSEMRVYRTHLRQRFALHHPNYHPEIFDNQLTKLFQIFCRK